MFSLKKKRSSLKISLIFLNFHPNNHVFSKKKSLHSESGSDLLIFLQNVFSQTRGTRFRKPP